MPSVFTDEAGTYDITITTAADFTVSSGGLPNGDNYVTGDGTIAATYNLEGDDFDFFDGTAWSVEFWLYYTTASTNYEFIMQNALAPAASFNQVCWGIFFNATEQLEFNAGNTGGSIGVSLASGTLSTSTWYHAVFTKTASNVYTWYLNNVLSTTGSGFTGTDVTPTASYRLWFGVGADGAGDLTSTRGTRVSKLAIYNRILNAAEINSHYLAMTAA